MQKFDYPSEREAREAWGRALDLGERSEETVLVEEVQEDESRKEIEKTQVTINFKNNQIKFILWKKTLSQKNEQV